MATYRKSLDVDDESWELKVERARAVWSELHFASDSERERLFRKIVGEWADEIEAKNRTVN